MAHKMSIHLQAGSESSLDAKQTIATLDLQRYDSDYVHQNLMKSSIGSNYDNNPNTSMKSDNPTPNLLDDIHKALDQASIADAINERDSEDSDGDEKPV